MSDFKAKVQAELNTTELEKQLKNLENGNHKIKIDADTGDTEKGVNNVNKQLQTSQKTASSFGNTLKGALNIGSAAALAAKGMQTIDSAAKQAVSSVKEIDSAIKDLRMATGESYSAVQNMVQGYNQMGQALGATTTEMTSAADAWLRQGHSISDTNTLIKDSMMLSKIAGIDAADSTQYLTSAMKGYQVAANDVAGIVDKLTAVDLVSATDAGGLAEAMSRVAVTADTAGVSMDRLLGYLATTGEVTQRSMSSIGEAYKTIFTRMSDIKSGKLKLIDDDGTEETLSDVEQTLANVGIDLRKTVTEYNDYQDVLDNLAAKWDSLSQVQQNALSKAFAGTRQAEYFRVLMENYDSAKKYADVAANSAGSAEAKFGAYLDSIEAKSKSLQAAFESLAMNNISTGLVGGILDASTAVLTFVDNTNLLQGAFAGLAVAGAVKGFALLKTGIMQAATSMDAFNTAMGLINAQSLGTAEFEQLISLTGNLSKSQLRAVVSAESLSTAQRMTILTSAGMTEAEASAALASMGLATAEGAATGATFSLAGALKGLWATLMANPLILIAAGVTAAVVAVSHLSKAYDDSKQTAEDSLSAYQDTVSELGSLNSELETTKNRIAELQALKDAGTITLAEKAELSKLQRQNDELERQISLLQQQAEIQQHQATQDAMDAVNTDPLFDDDIRTKAQKQMEVLAAMKEQRDKLYEDWNNPDISAETKDYLARVIENENADITEQASELSETISDLMTYRDTLAADSNLSIAGKSMLDSLNAIINEFNRIDLSSAEKNLDKIESFFSNTGSSALKDYILDAVSSGEEAEDVIKRLGLSLQDLGLPIDGGKELNKYFEDLANSANIAADAVEKVDGTMSGIETAKDSENAGDNYVSFSKYLEEAKSLYDQGLTGTDDFKTVAELISANIDSSAESFKKNYQSLKKYFTTDKDGNLTRSGIDRFVKDLTAATDKAGGSFKNTAEAANALGISTEAFEIILGRLNDYDIHTFDGITKSAEALSEAKDGLSQLQEIYDGLAAGDSKDALGDKISNWKELLDAADSDLSTLDTDIVLQITAELNLQQIQAQIDTAQQLIDEGDKSTTNYAEMNAYKAQYRSTSESALGWDSGNIKVPVEYELAGNTIEELQQQLSSVTDENRRMEIQAQISNLYDIQNEIMDAFRDAHPEITAETNPEEAQAALDEWINSEDGKKILAELHIDTTVASSVIGDLVKDANNKLKELGKTDIDFDLNDDLNGIVNQIDKAKDLLDQFRNEDGTVNLDLEGASEAQVILASLIRKKQELSVPVIMNVDTSNADAEVQSTIEALQQIQSLSNDLEVEVSVGADTSETQSKIQSAANAINPEVLAKLGVDTTEFDAQISALTDPKITASVALNDGAIAGIQGQISAISARILAKVDVETSKVDQYAATEKTSKGTVTWDNNTSKVDTWAKQNHSATGTVKWGNNTENVRTSFTATGTIKWKNGDGSFASGTAHSAGSALSRGTIYSKKTGRSYAIGKTRGDWSVGQNQTALINEILPEIIAHPDGTFEIANNGYPTFKKLHKNDIVFNGAHTKALLETGRIHSYGKFIGALASGTAGGKSFAVGSVSGRAFASGSTSSTSTNTMDWIEIALDRIERAVTKFTTRLENTFDSLTNRLTAVNDAISKSKQEYTQQQAAYNSYLKEAANVNLSDSLKALVRTGGTWVGSGWTDEVNEALEKYKDLYEKAQDCAQAMEELKESIADLYKQAFDIVNTRYDNEFDALAKHEALIQNNIDLANARGYSVNATDYESLIQYMEREVAKGQAEYNDLTAKLNSAVSSGYVAKWSDEWWAMYNEIRDVAGAIQEAQISLEEYQQAILDLQWDNFDYIQDQISNVAAETEFLIGLLSDSDLYDDSGKLTNSGIATLSLYNNQMQTYMKQAQDYAQAIKEIDNLLAKDPANQNLIDRKNELLEAQRDAIESAQDEKEAITDLITEAYEAQVDALQDIVDAYKDSLDSAQSLYEFQKKIQEGTENLASLQKQLAAYAGDTSEETKAKIQKLQVEIKEAKSDLEETQYEQYVSDTKKLLDNIVDEYEAALYAGLDDIDATLKDILAAVDDPQAINATIKSAAYDVGYTISDSLSEIIRFGDVTSVLNDISDTMDILNVASSVALGYNNDPVVDANGNVSTTSSSSSKSKQVGGYAKGGFITDLQKVAIHNGDDMVTVNTLKVGEAVLTPEQTNALSNIAPKLVDLEQMLDYKNFVLMDNIQPITDMGDINIMHEWNIDIAHADSWQDITYQMQHDPQFEKFIQSMTVDLLAGKSPLAKYKYWSR